MIHATHTRTHAHAHTHRDSSLFTDANMSLYDGVLFVSTSEGSTSHVPKTREDVPSSHGTVLNDDQQGVFTKWLQSGGVYSGVHLACGTLQKMPTYKAAVGGEYIPGPSLCTARSHMHSPL